MICILIQWASIFLIHCSKHIFIQGIRSTLIHQTMFTNSISCQWMSFYTWIFIRILSVLSVSHAHLLFTNESFTRVSKCTGRIQILLAKLIIRLLLSSSLSPVRSPLSLSKLVTFIAHECNDEYSQERVYQNLDRIFTNQLFSWLHEAITERIGYTSQFFNWNGTAFNITRINFNFFI